MIGVEKKIFRLSSSVLNRTFKQEKSIFCILEFNGSEMNVYEIIDRMESVGYITPNDFIIKQRERT